MGLPSQTGSDGAFDAPGRLSVQRAPGAHNRLRDPAVCCGSEAARDGRARGKRDPWGSHTHSVMSLPALPGFTFSDQAWIADPDAVLGASATNGLAGATAERQPGRATTRSAASCKLAG
jgi:hypothetical protein